jgi:hypothetical protein
MAEKCAEGWWLSEMFSESLQIISHRWPIPLPVVQRYSNNYSPVAKAKGFKMQ